MSIIFNAISYGSVEYNRYKINAEVSKMATTALERKALFKAAVTLRELTMAEAAAQLGISYNHLTLVLRGDRKGSARLLRDIAEFVGKDVRDLFDGRPQGTVRHEGRLDKGRKFATRKERTDRDD